MNELHEPQAQVPSPKSQSQLAGVPLSSFEVVMLTQKFGTPEKTSNHCGNDGAMPNPFNFMSCRQLAHIT